MKRTTIINFAIGILLGLTLAALVAFNTLLVYVATGPRSLDNFTPYIEKALVGESNVRVDIGQTWLIWDGWQHPVDIRLRDVSLLTKEGIVFSTFPEISLGIDVLALPFGQILPTSISVSKPIVSIKQNADKTLDFGAAAPSPEHIESTSDTLAVLVEFLINPNNKSSLRKLRTVELLGANFSIGNEAQGVIISAPDTTFIVRKESRTEIKALLRGAVKYGEHESLMNAQFYYNKQKKRFEGTVEAGKVQLNVLSSLLTDDPTLNALQLPLSGKATFAFNEKGKLDALQFAVDGGRGKIVHERIDGPLPVTRIKLIGKFTDGLTQGSIEKAEADFGGSHFTGSGVVMQNEKGMGITGQVAITNVPTEQAHLYWPLGLAPLSREWVTTNIKDGNITSASAKINIQPGDLAMKVLPKEAIDAEVDLRDTRIRYLSDHPEVRGLDARVKVDGLALDAAISTAQAFTETKLSNGRVYIADLNPDNPLIEVSLHADAPANDIVTLLGLPMLEHAKHLNLDAKKVSGRATADAKLGFYFFAKDEQGNDTPLTYYITGKADNISSPAFLKRFDISNATGDLVVDEKALEYTGSANVNGASLSAGKVRYAFTQENGIDTTIEAAGTVNDEALRRFGVNLPITIKEPLVVAVDATLSTSKDITTIPSFSMKGEKVNLSGNARLTPDGKDVALLRLENIRYGRTKLSSIEYGALPGGYMLHMKGSELDGRELFEKKGEGFSFEKFPAIDLDLDVEIFHGADEQDIKNLKAILLCSETRCSSANMSGEVDEGKFIFRIAPDGKNRKVGLTADNAGGLLRALGITKTMEDGMLTLAGQYADATDGKLTGTLRINDYTLVNAPILARMLSLASLTGFFDTLTGNGIAFKKLDAPFTLQNDVVTIKEGKSYGAAIGLTADGTITFPATTLQMEGTIVPSYTLNNVVGKVPLLGNLLTGGEGQGVFAARYTLKGDTDNPDVMVNPLSILTPGFLRHLFDAF